MIEARALVKSFGARRVLDRLYLRVEPGEPLALVGANGAGKTTLLRILATLTRPTSGSVLVDGMDVKTAGPRVRRSIGLLAHHPLLYDDLTAEANLRLYARLYGVPDGPRQVEALLERIGLSAWRAERLALARAFLHRPQVLLLDEPHTGLDAPGLALLDELLRAAAEAGRTILLTTHDETRARATGWRVETLAGGRCSSAAGPATGVARERGG